MHDGTTAELKRRTENVSRLHEIARMQCRQLLGLERIVMLLVAVEGLSYSEAAEVLGVPMGTIMSRLSRARQTIGSLFGAQERKIRRTGKVCFRQSFDGFNDLPVHYFVFRRPRRKETGKEARGRLWTIPF
jgi:predicted DNA-binding protein (UPF0251 family)